MMKPTARPRLFQSFAFIQSWIQIDGDLPLELIKGYFLARASAAQIPLIRNFLRELGSIHPVGNRCEVESIPRENGMDFSRIKDPAKWRYWVINFNGSNFKIDHLQLALNLLEADIEMGAVFIKGQQIYNTTTILHTHLSWEPMAVVNASSFQRVKGQFQKIKSLKTTHPNLYRLHHQFEAVKTLPRNNPFAALALFAIIEAAITHKPNDKEIGDSINHQIKTKMPLLERRFERKLNSQSFFPQLEAQKIWAKLYSYRSNLAHGESCDFRTKFKELEKEDTVIKFLRQTVKCLLLHSTVEPDLLSDLKVC